MHTRRALSVAALAAACTPAWSALVLTTDTSNPVDASAINDTITAAGMVGLQVTLTSVTGASSSDAWGATGTSSGAAASGGLGGWQLSASGNTFAALWQFSYNGTAPLASLTLDGLAGSILFDRANPNTGTAGSFRGSDFAVDLNGDGLTDDPDWTVTYARGVGLGGAAPLGDTWGRLTIQFGPNGYTGRGFSFLQDTDAFTPGDGGGGGGGGTVPEPASSALALVGLGLMWRRQRR